MSHEPTVSTYTIYPLPFVIHSIVSSQVTYSDWGPVTSDKIFRSAKTFQGRQSPVTKPKAALCVSGPLLCKFVSVSISMLICVTKMCDIFVTCTKCTKSRQQMQKKVMLRICTYKNYPTHIMVFCILYSEYILCKFSNTLEDLFSFNHIILDVCISLVEKHLWTAYEQNNSL